MGLFDPATPYMSPPLTYAPMRPHGQCDGGGNATLLLVLGVAAVALVLSQQQQQSLHAYRLPLPMELPRPHAIANGIASMAAAVVGTLTPGGGDGERPAEEVLSACKGTDVAIIDAKKATVAAPEASKEMDDKEKIANAAALRKWIKKHPKGVAVLFAHWCPHCKAMIAQLAEVAKGAPEGVAFLACNAEAVAADAFGGDDAVVALEYYPTVCKVLNGAVEQVADPEAAVEALKKGSEDTEAPAEATPPAPEDGEASTAAMLNMLF